VHAKGIDKSRFPARPLSIFPQIQNGLYANLRQITNSFGRRLCAAIDALVDLMKIVDSWDGRAGKRRRTKQEEGGKAALKF